MTDFHVQYFVLRQQKLLSMHTLIKELSKFNALKRDDASSKPSNSSTSSTALCLTLPNAE